MIGGVEFYVMGGIGVIWRECCVMGVIWRECCVMGGV